jgi:ubiquinone biosynthesis protein COQ4
MARSSHGPTWLQRIRVLLVHGSRILFRRWPDYSFDDLAAIQDTLDGPAFGRAAERMAQDVEGAAILRDRPRLSVSTVDWGYLRSLPTHTLGHCLWHHFTANGLLEEVELAPPRWPWPADTEYAKQRYRETHDLRHVLTGLGVSDVEEVLLQSFQFVQLPQVLSLGIVVLGGLKFALVDGQWRRLLRDLPRAVRSARRARFLSNVRFEELWERPLEEVRDELGLEPIGTAYPPAQRLAEAGAEPGGQRAA